MSLDRFCRKPLVTASPQDTVQRVAEMMREKHVGSVLVIDKDHKPIGVLTDRDVVCRVIALKHDPQKATVGETMTEGIGFVRKTDLIDEALLRMRQLGVRRLPIVDAAGKAMGIVTLDDLMVLLTGELGQTAAVIRSNRGP